jgi:hypothetical protein
VIEFSADVQEAIYISLTGLFLTIVTSFCAWYLGYYSIPKNSETNPPEPIPLMAVITIFALFLGISIVLVPGTIYGWYVIVKGVPPESQTLSASSNGWINIVTIIATFAAFLVYLAVFPRKWKSAVLGVNYHRSRTDFLQNLQLGFLSWILSYPPVLFVSSLISAILIHFHGKLEIDQIAVSELKATSQEPLLLFMMVFCIIFIVPFIEELLFRGFFQTWLKQKVGIIGAILTSSALFALFHFSSTQDILNFELIPALFIFSCFLGFLFEKQRTLQAPIILHALFNAISILMILANQ